MRILDKISYSLPESYLSEIRHREANVHTRVDHKVVLSSSVLLYNFVRDRLFRYSIELSSKAFP